MTSYKIFSKLLILKILIFFLCANFIYSNDQNHTICRVQYSGGGDWYSDPSSVPNLLKYINLNTNIKVHSEEVKISLKDQNIFNYPYLYMTGHGNIKLSEIEIKNLRLHLLNGGFLHVDDNYGLDESFRREIKKVFPKKNLIEIPFNHPIFSSYFIFKNGLPKIHEHDNKPPTAFGLFDSNRLILFYTFETDLGDGWEDASVHNNSDIKRTEALKMGVNIFTYSLIQ